MVDQENVLVAARATEMKNDDTPGTITANNDDTEEVTVLLEENTHVQGKHDLHDDVYVEERQSDLGECAFDESDIGRGNEASPSYEAEADNEGERRPLASIESVQEESATNEALVNETSMHLAPRDEQRRFSQDYFLMLDELVDDADISWGCQPEPESSSVEQRIPLFGFELLDPVDNVDGNGALIEEDQSSMDKVQHAAQVVLPLTPEYETDPWNGPLSIADDSNLVEELTTTEVPRTACTQLPLTPESYVAPEDVPLPDDERWEDEISQESREAVESSTPETTADNALIESMVSDFNDMKLDEPLCRQELGRTIQDDEDQPRTDVPEIEDQEFSDNVLMDIDEDQDMLDEPYLDFLQTQEGNVYFEESEMMLLDDAQDAGFQDTEMILDDPTPEHSVATVLAQAVYGDPNLMIAGMSDEEHNDLIAQQQIQAPVYMKQATAGMPTVNPNELAIAPFTEQGINMLAHANQTMFIPEEHQTYTEQAIHMSAHAGQTMLIPRETPTYNETVFIAEDPSAYTEEEYQEDQNQDSDDYVPELPTVADIDQANRATDEFLESMSAPLLDSQLGIPYNFNPYYDPSSQLLEERARADAMAYPNYNMVENQPNYAEQRSEGNSANEAMETTSQYSTEANSAAETEMLSDDAYEPTLSFSSENVDRSENMELGQIFHDLNLGSGLPSSNEPDFDKVNEGTSFNFAHIQEQEDLDLEAEMVEAFLADEAMQRVPDAVESDLHPFQYPSTEPSHNEEVGEPECSEYIPEPPSAQFVFQGSAISNLPILHEEVENDENKENELPPQQQTHMASDVVEAKQESVVIPAPQNLKRSHGSLDTENEERAATRIKVRKSDNKDAPG